MSIKIKLRETPKDFENLVFKALAEDFNKNVARFRVRIYRDLRAAIKGWVMSQPEIDSLTSEGKVNTLNAQFGLPRGSSNNAVDVISDAVADSVVVNIDSLSLKLNGIKGGLTIGVQPARFVNMLNLPEASVVTKKGVPLNWLEWLLVRGDEIVIVGYEYTDAIGYGRSGGGIMEKGSSFRVDPKYSGTLEDNFITRALSGRESQIAKIISDAISR